MIDWMVFYAAFNSISVISQWQLPLFMSFLVFTSTRLGSKVSCPRTLPWKKPRGSSAARTQDPWITSQTLYHWATRDLNNSNSQTSDTNSGSIKYKAFEDYTLNVTEIMTFGCERAKNIVGKGENAAKQHFLLFLLIFWKSIFLRTIDPLPHNTAFWCFRDI